MLTSTFFTDNKLVILTTGAKIPVHFESQVISSSVANLGSLIDAAKIKSRLDFVYALVRVVNTEDDQVRFPMIVVSYVAFFLKYTSYLTINVGIVIINTVPTLVCAFAHLISLLARFSTASGDGECDEQHGYPI